MTLPVPTIERRVERTEPDASRERHEKAHRDRSVGLRPLGDGMTRMTPDITASDAAAMMHKLTGAAHQLPADDGRTIDQARADLFVDTLLDRRAGAPGYRAVIGITVPLSLMGPQDRGPPGAATTLARRLRMHHPNLAHLHTTSRPTADRRLGPHHPRAGGWGDPSRVCRCEPAVA
ncbi:MAG: DUF222 domain-containing protein [Aeromicrobium sp.]